MSQSKPNHPAKRSIRNAAFGLSALCLAVPLGGCGVDRTVTGSIVAEDIRDRHPIVLANTATTLDIFSQDSAAGAMDEVSKRQLREFAQNYRLHGEGQITALVPAGGASAVHARHAMDAVRRELANGGARGFISVGSYPVADPSLAAPIRLSFIELKGRVGNRCGEWPSDLASGSSVESWTNRPFWNYGCAYQNSFAVQVDNPRDLAGPRAEQPADTTSRIRAITKVREGNDPGTSWKTKNSSISSTGE